MYMNDIEYINDTKYIKDTKRGEWLKMLGILKNFLDDNAKEIKKLSRHVDEINALEPEIKALGDDALRAKTEEFRNRLQEGETLNDLLPEAFAVVREASVRTLGMRHFDVQLMGRHGAGTRAAFPR